MIHLGVLDCSATPGFAAKTNKFVLVKFNARFLDMTLERLSESIRLVQFTDCHLHADAAQAYKGYYPERRFDSVIADIRQRSANSGAYDHLIMSGDLAQFGASSVYQRILDKTVGLARNRHWVPGNHDDKGLMSQFSDMAAKVVVQGDWAIVLLDSTNDPDGVGSGAISDADLHLLAQADQLSVSYILLVLHHPPISVNSIWQDKIKLSNSYAFWQVVNSLTKVQAISFGHLHQELHLVRDNIDLFCTPATTYQYKAAQKEVTIEDEQELAKAAYRLFELYPNGAVGAEIVRVS